MILSDHDLKALVASNNLVVKPLTENTIQQNGIDFIISDQVGEQAYAKTRVIYSTSNESIKDHYKINKANDDGCFIFLPFIITCLLHKRK